VALVDRNKIGLNFTVIVSVTLKSQVIEYVEEFSRQIAALDEVAEAFITAVVSDYILKVIVKDPETYNDFYAKKLSAIPQISKIQSSYVMTYIKESTALHF
jgi:Lrp/AsnC family leucine-responsive transcriptional regulator